MEKTLYGKFDFSALEERKELGDGKMIKEINKDFNFTELENNINILKLKEKYKEPITEKELDMLIYQHQELEKLRVTNKYLLQTKILIELNLFRYVQMLREPQDLAKAEQITNDIKQILEDLKWNERQP